MGRPVTNTKDRFIKMIEHHMKDGCWIFPGIRIKGGYMLYGHTLAHRYSYEIFKGEIPKGLTIDHICKNPSCVNPYHLEAVTQKVNNLRGDGFSGANARKTHCPKGHEYTKENTMITNSGISRSCRTCRRERGFIQRRKDGANIRIFKQKKTV